jgi:nucleoid-associated protein YgaU
MILNDLNQQATNELELASLYLLKDWLEVLQQNLNSLLAGDGSQTVTVNGTNLYALAAKYYGDATYWNVLAQANFEKVRQLNGFIDPNLVGNVTLVIPPKPGSPTGGIYSA